MTYLSKSTHKSKELKSNNEIRKRKKRIEMQSLVYWVKLHNGCRPIGEDCWIEERFKKCVRRRRSAVERESDKSNNCLISKIYLKIKI